MEAAREITDVASSLKEIEMKNTNRRKRLSIYDDKLWEGFEEEGIDRILRGEITPKNLIITCPLQPILKKMILKKNHGCHHLEREHLIVKELLSVFPNSKTIEWETYKPLEEILHIAKRMGFTSIIIGRCTPTHDEMRIISMMNGAYSCFRVFDLIPADLGPRPPNHGNPTSNALVCMERFKSPASVGTARMIQSLFPKVSVLRQVSVPPSRRSSIVTLKKEKSRIYFRHHRLKALRGEKRLIPQECRPEFSFMLTSVMKISFRDRGRMGLHWVAKEPYKR